MPRRCLLTVHAHPDDEASKGAGTVARYHAEGVHTVLVTCTGGEEGDILNPAMDLPEVRDNIGEVRRVELERAAAIIGYDEIEWLGYRDSGMPDSPANSDPRSFAQAPLDEAVGRLVAVIRRTRPEVIVTYPKEQSSYPHPDHLRVSEISELAFDAAGDQTLYPDAGEVWQPLRMFYVRWSVKRVRAMHDKFLEMGLESPYGEDWLLRLRKAESEPVADAGQQVVVDVTGFSSVTRESLRAHATQVDPTSRHWFGLPPEVADAVYPYEEYELARDLTAGLYPTGDLFAGIDAPAVQSRAG